MKRLFFLFILIGLTWVCYGQSILELREKKNTAQQDINFTSGLLEKAREDEKSSLSKLNLINSQIQSRSDFIESLNLELALLDGIISNNVEVIEMLQRDLIALKEEYASMIRFAQINKSSYDLIFFVFSAENLNQIYKRFLYLRQYSNYRKKQIEVIRLLSDIVEEKLVELETDRLQNELLLSKKEEENILLVENQKEQNQHITALQKKQKDLRKTIREQELQQEQLNNAIEKLLAEETGALVNTGEFELTPEQKLISTDFEKNKGLIPWPIERGIITEHFGVHAHAVLKQVQVKNNGIDISTQEGAKARVVFDGEVSKVFAISGSNMAVIVRHGSFLSVYSNLKEVYVTAGQKVNIKQEIGSVYTDISDGNKTVLKFQIWEENQKLNPEDWISK